MKTIVITEKLTGILHHNPIIAYNPLVIYPYGGLGHKVEEILREQFGFENIHVLDFHDKSCQHGHSISAGNLKDIIAKNGTVLLCSDNISIYYQLRDQILKYVPKENVIDLAYNWKGDIDLVKAASGGKDVRILFNPTGNWNYSFELKNGNPMEAVGWNTGNLVFTQLIKSTLEYDYEAVFTYEFNREEYGTEHVWGIMPGSNFINPQTTWIELCNAVLEKTDMHFTIAGIGAQAGMDDTPNGLVRQLSKEQIRFFRLVSEHAKTIGVRGEFSAECLREMGIGNAEIIGCPSYFAMGGVFS